MTPGQECCIRAIDMCVCRMYCVRFDHCSRRFLDKIRLLVSFSLGDWCCEVLLQLLLIR